MIGMQKAQEQIKKAISAAYKAILVKIVSQKTETTGT
jgi:hypothetical protein